MDYNNLDLRNKTFLDFTDDAKIINKIIGNLEFFKSHITDDNRAETFIFFAEMTDDKKLAKAINKEFAEEIESMFDE